MLPHLFPWYHITNICEKLWASLRDGRSCCVTGPVKQHINQEHCSRHDVMGIAWKGLSEVHHNLTIAVEDQ